MGSFLVIFEVNNTRRVHNVRTTTEQWLTNCTKFIANQLYWYLPVQMVPVKLR